MIMIIIMVIAAPIITLIYVHEIWNKGILDARYPGVADGDWRTGWRRRIYLAGVERGKFLIQRDRDRRRITVERRNG